MWEGLLIGVIELFLILEPREFLVPGSSDSMFCE